MYQYSNIIGFDIDFTGDYDDITSDFIEDLQWLCRCRPWIFGLQRHISLFYAVFADLISGLMLNLGRESIASAVGSRLASV